MFVQPNDTHSDIPQHLLLQEADVLFSWCPAQCTTAGWRFPWGLRVRLCEMLLRGVFDTLDETSYIEGADDYLKLLQVRIMRLFTLLLVVLGLSLSLLILLCLQSAIGSQCSA